MAVNLPARGSTIIPAQFQAVSKLSEHDNDLGTAVQAWVPPDVAHDSYIVACAGPNDEDMGDGRGNSAPEWDGWFHSDFYLMKALCRNTATHQSWISCVDPERLVKRYTRFVHGSPRGTRRIVLDAGELPLHRDVVVAQDVHLRSAFLGQVEQVLKRVGKTKTQVILMLFGHGSNDLAWNFGIHLGGSAFQRSNLARKHFVTPLDIKEIIMRTNPAARVTVMTTACFSGGWSFCKYGNFSSLQGTQASDEIRSHPRSVSNSQAAGSKWATAVAESLCRLELSGGDEDDEEPDFSEIPSYAALTKTVHDVLLQEVDNSEVAELPSFAAQDDIWEQDWRAKIGVPMSTFRQNYMSLRSIQVGDHLEESKSAFGGVTAVGSASSQMSEYVKLPHGLMVSRQHARAFALILTDRYKKVIPGSNTTASNGFLHLQLHRLLNGGNDFLQEIIDSLTYRISLVALCNRYRFYLGSDAVELPPCDYLDCERETKSPAINQNRKHWQNCYELVCKWQNILFDKPIKGQGCTFQKPIQYISLLLFKLNWSRDNCIVALKHLAKMKRRTSPIDIAIDRLDIANRPAARQQLRDIASRTKRQVRDFSNPESPTKKARLN